MIQEALRSFAKPMGGKLCNSEEAQNYIVKRVGRWSNFLALTNTDLHHHWSILKSSKAVTAEASSDVGTSSIATQPRRYPAFIDICKTAIWTYVIQTTCFQCYLYLKFNIRLWHLSKQSKAIPRQAAFLAGERKARGDNFIKTFWKNEMEV